MPTQSRSTTWYGRLFLVVGLLGCEHPIAVVSQHVEAADAVIRTLDGRTIARTIENRRWDTDTIRVVLDAPTQLVVAFVDFQGQEFSVSARRDISIRAEAEDPALLTWEPLSGSGRLIGFASGTTRIRFLAWHVDHADFITPWLTVRVSAAGTSAIADLSPAP
jgi:hypothetical protein